MEYNALKFLEGSQERERYRPSFRVASHALHWGHVPLSYAGAEGIVRAAHIDAKIYETVKDVMDEVITFGALSCATEEHSEKCADTVLQGEHPFELYKWFSAWLVKRRWRRIWGAIKGLVPSGVSEEEVRTGAIRTLVCREDPGYQLLSLCRLADYVPRDLLQAGTAWLTVDVEALWETSPNRSDRAQEWSLLEAARDYLEERFFLSPDAQLVHSLASRAIGQGLKSQGFSRETLLSLLESTTGDEHYFSSFGPYHRARIGSIRSLTEGDKIHQTWEHIGTFHDVHVPPMTRLEAEDLLTKRKGVSRIAYPMTKNYSVVVEPNQRRVADQGEVRRVSVCLHHKSEGGVSSARPALDIALETRRRQSRFAGEDVAAGIASWLSKQRVELRYTEVWRAAGRALKADEDRAKQLLRALWDHPTFSIEREPNRYRRHIGALVFNRDLREGSAGQKVLGLPLEVARDKDGKALLECLRDAAINLVKSGPGRGQGAALEAAVAADQLLSPDPCTHRLLILGATALASEGQPISEWDVLRLDLLSGKDWRLTAVECSVNNGDQKAAEDREKLEMMGVALDQRFSDLREYRTRLARLDGQGIRYIDARRGFART